MKQSLPHSLIWLISFLVLDTAFVFAQDPIPGGCLNLGPNLVVNPEFEEGNIGFSSSYSFHPDYTCGFGQYTINTSIINDPVGGASCYSGTGFDLTTIWAASDRNDPGVGNFLILDPTDTTGGNFVIWEQTIDVCPGNQYVFSAFAKNLFFLESTFPYSGIDPIFDLTINGDTVVGYYVDGVLFPGGTFNPLGRQSINDNTVWTQISGTWESGTNTTATITIKNTVPGNEGNDIAIDGVFLGLCGRSVDFSPNTDLGQCAQLGTIQPVTLTLTAPTIASGWQSYEWYKNGALVQSDPAPTPFTTPADVNGEYFGTYQLRVFQDPLGSASGSCGSVSKQIVIFDDCQVSFPVELVGFDAEIQGSRAVLSWATAWESQNAGFEVQMAKGNDEFEPVGFVKGVGSSQTLVDYSFLSAALTPDTYRFRLQQVDFDGKATLSDEVELTLADYQDMVVQLFPNPAAATATLDIAMPVETRVSAELIGMDGRIVLSQTWNQMAGTKNLQWEIPVADVPSGVYLVRVRGISQSLTKLVVQH